MSPLQGWQVTLCDPIWHVSSRSGVATLRTAIHLLLLAAERCQLKNAYGFIAGCAYYASGASKLAQSSSPVCFWVAAR